MGVRWLIPLSAPTRESLAPAEIPGRQQPDFVGPTDVSPEGATRGGLTRRLQPPELVSSKWSLVGRNPAETEPFWCGRQS